MAHNTQDKMIQARKLLEGFSQRTGLEGTREPTRYLWTDALAVRCYFGLYRTSRKERDQQRALQLVKQTQETLGRFTEEDQRVGWISGYSWAKGSRHPTAGGLRIGKDLPERRTDQKFDDQLEWDRDGQYFHYLTQWAYSLLAAHRETRDPKYLSWAAELMQAGSKFLARTNGSLRMYWKMSVDLTRPLVEGMGAHDPLEGLLLTRCIQEKIMAPVPELEVLARDFFSLCHGRDWKTPDPLGTGALLLNTVRAANLGVALPESVQPEKLLEDSLHGLDLFAESRPASQRLAFRECGLSLGLAVLFGNRDSLEARGLSLAPFEKHVALKETIENFWLDPANHTRATWTDHLDINAVSLASSLVAEGEPTVI